MKIPPGKFSVKINVCSEVKQKSSKFNLWIANLSRVSLINKNFASSNFPSNNIAPMNCEHKYIQSLHERINFLEKFSHSLSKSNKIIYLNLCVSNSQQISSGERVAINVERPPIPPADRATRVNDVNNIVHPKFVRNPAIPIDSPIEMNNTRLENLPTSNQRENTIHTNDVEMHNVTRNDLRNARSPESTRNDSRPRQNVTIIGDSMLNGIVERGLQKELDKNQNNKTKVKVRNHPGATTTQMIHHVTAQLMDKPDLLIIHCGTNDLTKKDMNENGENTVKIDTIKNMNNIFKLIQEKSPSTQIAWSNITTRKDRDKPKKHAFFDTTIKKLNAEMRPVCAHNQAKVLEHTNFCKGKDDQGKSCLGYGGLHPSGYGNNILAGNFIDFIKSF